MVYEESCLLKCVCAYVYKHRTQGGVNVSTGARSEVWIRKLTLFVVQPSRHGCGLLAIPLSISKDVQ